MKKIFTYAFAAMLGATALSASAENVALFSFTMSREAEGTDYQFEMSAANGLKVQVDWGDGELSAPVTLNDNADGWGTNSTITGKIAGPKITVYGETPADVQRIDVGYTQSFGEDAKIKTIDVSKLTGLLELVTSTNALSSVDVSACTKLQKLYINNNNVTSLTLPASEDLTYIDAGNTVTIGFEPTITGGNQVLGTDWSKAPNLATLYINGNDYNNYSGLWPDELDLSKNTKLATLYANVCNLPEIDLSNNKLIKSINVQCNALTSIDLSNLDMATLGDNKVIVFAGYNQLNSIKLPDTSTNRFMRLNIINNAFTFATLPPTTCVKTASNFVYSPQAAITNPLDGHNTVDLSSLATVGDTASEFSWSAILDGATEPSELTTDAFQYEVVKPGVFKFLVPVKELTGTITNEIYPKLTLKTTTATSVGLLGELMSFEVSAKEGANTINIGLIPTEAQNVYVDWGDGEFAGPYALEVMGYDYTPNGIDVVVDDWWDETCPEVKGNKIVIKGNPETIQTVQIRSGYAWGESEANMAQVTSIDLSKLTNLVKLSLDNNALTSIDLSNNTKLVKLSLAANKLTAFDAALPALTNLDISNQQSSGKVTFGANKIESIDYTKLPELTDLTANACGLKADFTKAAKLEDVSIMGNGYTEFAPVSATINRVSLNYNELTSMDATGLTAESVNIFAGYNKMGAEPIKLPAGANNVNVANNKFTFATLPAVNSVKGTLTYNNQADMEVEAKDGVVDLSSQAKVGETATVFAWTEGENAIADTDFAAANGVFTFNKAFTGAVCTMTNEAFPKLTLKTVALDITAASAVNEIGADDNAPVEYFNLQGVKVANPENGLYIRRQGNKTEKVMVK